MPTTFPDDPGGGGLDTPNLTVSPPHNHPQQSLTYAKALGGESAGSSNLKKFAEIVAQQKEQRNVLEVKIKKIQASSQTTPSEAPSNPRNLTMDDISELTFDILGIKFEECVGIDFWTGRYDSREIILKPGVDTTKYITTEPIIFKEHEVHVKKMLVGMTKVTFKNVPMYVPDEEILHLCGVYGTVQDNKVHWETIRVSTSTQKGVLVSPTGMS